MARLSQHEYIKCSPDACTIHTTFCHPEPRINLVQDWEGAVKGFTSLLDLQRPEDSAERIGALANRSAAHLGASNASACLTDCTTALTLLLSPVVPPDEASDKKETPAGPHQRFACTCLSDCTTALTLMLSPVSPPDGASDAPET